jgi:hypothetical protein
MPQLRGNEPILGLNNQLHTLATKNLQSVSTINIPLMNSHFGGESITHQNYSLQQCQKCHTFIFTSVVSASSIALLFLQVL